MVCIVVGIGIGRQSPGPAGGADVIVAALRATEPRAARVARATTRPDTQTHRQTDTEPAAATAAAAV
jgi:hypothetical protein